MGFGFFMIGSPHYASLGLSRLVVGHGLGLFSMAALGVVATLQFCRSVYGAWVLAIEVFGLELRCGLA